MPAVISAGWQTGQAPGSRTSLLHPVIQLFPDALTRELHAARQIITTAFPAGLLSASVLSYLKIGQPCEAHHLLQEKTE
jgi:hypothetical protein